MMQGVPAKISFSMACGLIAALALTASPSVDAAPKKGTKGLPTPIPSKSLPAPSGVQKGTESPHRLDPSASSKLKAVGPLSRAQKRDLLAKRGINLSETEIRSPTALTPRRPYRDRNTHLSFVGGSAVLPGDNIAYVLGAFVYPNEAEAWPPLGFVDGGGGEAPPRRPTSFVAVQFRAAENLHYIVDCRVYAEGGAFATQVWSEDTYVGEGAQHSNGHVAQLVMAAPNERNVSVLFYNGGQAFGVDRCDITPAG